MKQLNMCFPTQCKMVSWKFFSFYAKGIGYFVAGIEIENRPNKQFRLLIIVNVYESKCIW